MNIALLGDGVWELISAGFKKLRGAAERVR